MAFRLVPARCGISLSSNPACPSLAATHRVGQPQVYGRPTARYAALMAPQRYIKQRWRSTTGVVAVQSISWPSIVCLRLTDHRGPQNACPRTRFNSVLSSRSPNMLPILPANTAAAAHKIQMHGVINEILILLQQLVNAHAQLVVNRFKG